MARQVCTVTHRLHHHARTNCTAAPIVDHAQHVRSVREDTADLASYALSDQASSIMSASPPPRQRSESQTQLEAYFGSLDDDTLTPRNLDDLRNDPIQELSEPVSPDLRPSSHKSPGTSVLTSMLRNSPPDRSPHATPPDADTPGFGGRKQANAIEHERQTLFTASIEDGAAATENTPLVPPKTDDAHVDWIRTERDIEGQGMKHKTSWKKLRKAASWPKNKGLEYARIAVNPKCWNRKAIWQNGVVEPVGYLPAVVLGCLLNILDALSYGMWRRPRKLNHY